MKKAGKIEEACMACIFIYIVFLYIFSLLSAYFLLSAAFGSFDVHAAIAFGCFANYMIFISGWIFSRLKDDT